VFTNDKLSQTYFNVSLSHFFRTRITYFTVRNKIRRLLYVRSLYGTKIYPLQQVLRDTW